MKKCRMYFAGWLLMAACLYFFENNSGTRIALLCPLLFLLIPGLRAALFSVHASGKKEAPKPMTVQTFSTRETDEPGELRLYQPGDPVHRIHWKLSAKKDELLLRTAETGQEDVSETAIRPSPPVPPQQKSRFPAAVLAAGLLLCVLLLLLIPEANRGMQALCNRIFAASERVNAYAYTYFPVSEDQPVLPAALLASLFILLLLILTVLRRSRPLAMILLSGCTLFQVYFGLAFPAWINVLLYAPAGLWIASRPLHRKSLLTFCLSVLLVSLLVTLLLPGVDAATEAASEVVRDHLSRIASQITGGARETSAGETETRHVHTRSLETGDREARAEQEYQLVTVEEEQISIPHWINWMKMMLMLVLAVALIVLPFAPFFVLNSRKKKAQEARKAFASENVAEAVQAVFQQVITWLEATGHDAGNLLYRDWAGQLPAGLPDGYGDRFAQCAADFEEAVYSRHAMPEEKRQSALRLLKETEVALWKTADRKQRFRLKYWMCICE